jgi:hypothetical protein
MTAWHCLRDADLGSPQLELRLADGEVIPARVGEHSPGADLALIELLIPRALPLIPPRADLAGQGDAWIAPYRPGPGDPYLSGDVVSGSVAYECAAGDEIDALQLSCAQHLGDYSGYSGGPVERSAAGREAALLGVLLEQSLDRRDAGRAADVLWAATIAEAVRHFSYFDVAHLMKVLPGASALADPQPADREQHPAGPRISSVRAIIDLLVEQAACGVLDAADVRMLAVRALTRLADDA